MLRSPLLLVLCSGCNEWWPGGTGVGNPGSSSVKTRKTGDVWLERGAGVLSWLEVSHCPDGPQELTEVEREIDLLGDGPFSVPGGRWCQLQLRFDGPLLYSGARDNDPDEGTFELMLEVGVVTLPADRSHIDGEALIIELGHDDWLDEDLLGDLREGTHVEVGPGDPVHDRLAGAIASGSAVFIDEDGDGEVSAEERARPVAAGERWLEEEEGEDDDGEDDR